MDAFIFSRLRCRFYFTKICRFTFTNNCRFKVTYYRGTNENTNGLVRQYLPKHTSFEFITDEMLQSIESNLNRRPRKRLNYYTPDEYYKLLTDTREKSCNLILNSGFENQLGNANIIKTE